MHKMKKIIRILLASLFLAAGSFHQVRADEGMWLLNMIKKLNEADMQKLGCKLTAEQIYSVNQSSIKDAIVSMGGFCTGQVISEEGLMITNHHCGLGQVQAHSSPENDYLTNGFWAADRDSELPNPGLFVRFLVRMEDVTGQVYEQLSDTLTESQRSQSLPGIFKEITEAATEDNDYTASVKSMFGGNEYYLFVYETYNDVRLVGAPSMSVGNYGGDTDNWMWPRHTGDFSLFRIYAGKDGKPAEYSEENVPLKARHFIPLSIAGVEEDDFTMIMGFPGRTERYLTSGGVKMALDVTNPAIVRLREKKLEIIEADMKADDEVRIKYQSKKNRISNYWKYFIGQSKQLKRMKVGDQKRDLEDKFDAWVNADPDRKARYGAVTTNLRKSYEEMSELFLTRVYLSEIVFRHPEILSFSYGATKLEKVLSGKDATDEDIQKAAGPLHAGMEEHFKNYNLDTDRNLFAAMLELYARDIPLEMQAPVFREIESKYKNDFEAYAKRVFDKSVFTTPERLKAFLDKPSLKKLQKDPAYHTATSIMNYYRSSLQGAMREIQYKLNANNRLFIKGLREMHPDRSFFPDANSTMRMSYGSVQDYDPMDAVHYDWFTTIDGVMEKMDNSHHEFTIRPVYEELYKKRDFGRYGSGGTLRTCFISNNDITGGNSGSGVLNANGELIGLAFDGNWEAMSGDIAFDPVYKRTINVDIRYVLWVIEKIGKAQHLIDEMTIREAPPREEPQPAVEMTTTSRPQ